MGWHRQHLSTKLSLSLAELNVSPVHKILGIKFKGMYNRKSIDPPFTLPFPKPSNPI